MKKLFFLAMICTVISCGSGTGNKYEKAIADNLQTSKSGTWTDLKFKVIELNELKQITVGDSVQILNDEQEKFKGEWIGKNKQSLTNYKEKLDKENNKKNRSKSMIEFYENLIEKTQNRIDSLQNTTSVEAKKYESMDVGKVLAVVVRCKYSIVPPTLGTEVHETFDFVLNADGSKVISKTKAKN